MRSVPGIAAAGALVLAASACGGGGGSGQAPGGGGQQLADGKTFTMVLAADPGNLDPQFTALSGTLQVDRFLYDSLVNFGPDGKMLAGLAEKWEATTTKATFTLRKGITCADGTPLTPKTVAENISFVGDPKNKSTRITVFVPAGATAVGDDAAGTVTVTSPTPSSFLDRTVGALHIVCPKGMKDRNILKQGADGTGMFTVTEAVANDHYTLTRRKDYAWGPGDWKKDQPGLPDKVVLRVVQNETTAANLLASGEVNVARVVGPDKTRLAGMGLFQREVVSPLGELWFNQKAGRPGADESVRRALTQALDLNQLGQVLTSGSGKPATGLVAPGLSPCTQNTVGSNLPGHDAAAAKSSLDGKGTKMTFLYPTSVGQTMQAAAELLQKMWSAAGVQVDLKGVSDAELNQVAIAGQGEWDAGFIPLGIALPSEMISFLSGPTPPNGVNFAGIKNEAYTAAVQKASATPGDAGCDQWAAAEVALFQHVDIVPFVNSATQTFAKGATFELSDGSLLPGSIRMLG